MALLCAAQMDVTAKRRHVRRRRRHFNETKKSGGPTSCREPLGFDPQVECSAVTAAFLDENKVV